MTNPVYLWKDPALQATSKAEINSKYPALKHWFKMDSIANGIVDSAGDLVLSAPASLISDGFTIGDDGSGVTSTRLSGTVAAPNPATKTVIGMSLCFPTTLSGIPFDAGFVGGTNGFTFAAGEGPTAGKVKIGGTTFAQGNFSPTGGVEQVRIFKYQPNNSAGLNSYEMLSAGYAWTARTGATTLTPAALQNGFTSGLSQFAQIVFAPFDYYQSTQIWHFTTAPTDNELRLAAIHMVDNSGKTLWPGFRNRT